MYLLDINVLIALADPFHIHSARAHHWFSSIRGHVWATCPIVENGFLRIVGASSYPRSPGPPQVANGLLRQICACPGYQFWPDSISLRHMSKVPTSPRLTDFYLLAIAAQHQGKLATLDQRIDASQIQDGNDAYFLIPEN